MLMLRKVTLPLLLLVLLCTTLTLGTTTTLFQANFDGSAVRVTWNVANESGVLGYDLYRKTTNDPSFDHLTTIPPTGRSRYQWFKIEARNRLNQRERDICVEVSPLTPALA